jgi:lipoate-protein ligase A
MDLADREWRLIREEARPGPMQMALDEVAAETAAAGGPRTVRLYRWEPSCLSLGYHQDPDTVDWAWCSAAGVDVTRRPTGGGGIYHDAVGDISYSITAPRDELPGSLMDCYHDLLDPVLDGFGRVDVPVGFVSREAPALYEPACYLRALNPAHDLVVPDRAPGAAPDPDADHEADTDTDTGGDHAAERKVSGNAQYRQRDAVVQHGSVTYSVVADRHLSAFVDPGVSPEEFAARVTGIDEHADVSRDAVVSAFEAALAAWCDPDEGSWTDDELARARERAAEKYSAEGWVRRRPRDRARS